MLRAFALACLTGLVGCDASIERFQPNRVHALVIATTRSTPTEAALQDTSALVGEWLGTPDEPKWPLEQWTAEEPETEDRLRSLVRLERLRVAAGPVKSLRSGQHLGLYREHCVVCHGLEGGGAGPASAYQTPYPRDFRAGIVKWKRTERPAKPTREDLRLTLRRGIPGTAMPSFAQLEDSELEALIDYVIYLSIRGELERTLLAAAVDELDYGSTPPENTQWRLVSAAAGDGASRSIAPSEGLELARQRLSAIGESWLEAVDRVVPVPALITADASWIDDVSTEVAPTPGWAGSEDSLLRGRAVFQGTVANCAGCHGPDGDGAVATLDFDDWAKEYSTRLGFSPADEDAMRPLREAGALPPKQADPRNLQTGVFRGGGSPETLYRRITQGIAGTPMPGVAVTDQPTAKSLSVEQVRDLIRYVHFLGRGAPGGVDLAHSLTEQR